MKLQHKIILGFVATLGLLIFHTFAPQHALAAWQDCDRYASQGNQVDIGSAGTGYHYMTVSSGVQAKNQGPDSITSPYNVIDSRFCASGGSHYNGSGGGNYGGSMTSTDLINLQTTSGAFSWDDGSYGTQMPIHMELGFPASVYPNGLGGRLCVPNAPNVGVPIAQCNNYAKNANGTYKNGHSAGAVDDAGRLVIGGVDHNHTIWCSGIKTNYPANSYYKDCGPDILSLHHTIYGCQPVGATQICGNSGFFFRADQACAAALGFACSPAGNAAWGNWYLGPWGIGTTNMDGILGRDGASYLTGFYLHYEAHNTYEGGFGAGNSWTLKFPKNAGTCSMALSPSNPGPGDTVTATVTFTNTGTRPWWTVPAGYNMASHVITGGPTVNHTWAVGGPITTNHTKTITDTYTMPIFGTADFTYHIKQASGTIPVTTTPGGHTCSKQITVNGNIACSGMTPDTVEPNTPFDMVAHVGYNNGTPTTRPFHISKIYYDVQPGVNTNDTGLSFNPASTTAPANGETTGTFHSNGSFAGNFVIEWYFDITNLGPRVNCTDTLKVARRPYMKVFGGDVMAGSGFADISGSCDNNGNTGSIFGFNNGSPNYTGAGTQLAAFAMGAIDQFASNNGQANGGLSPPKSLTFANSNPSDPSPSAYGGNFQSASCIGDYYDAASGGSGASVFNFDTTTRCQPSTALCIFNIDTVGAPFNAGFNLYNNYAGHLVYRLNAIRSDPVNAGNTDPTKNNVYIKGNVTLADNTWASPSQIPYFYVIVKGGDIYIDANVTHLDGVYIALPDEDGNGGNIYDCTDTANHNGTGAVSLFPAAWLDLDGLSHVTNPSSSFTDCQYPLTVNGAFIANQVWFLRTPNSINQATVGEVPGTSHAAEIFNYSPTLWLNSPFKTSSSSTLPTRAQVSLPPIL